MKTSELLRRAEEFLWDGIHNERYNSITLCGAVTWASLDQGPLALFARDRANNTIMNALLGNTTYTQWAEEHRHLPPGWGEKHEYWRPIIQANRLNWLRELQHQFELKGD